MLNTSFYALGVMSGTSLDGVDIAYIRFDSNQVYDFEIIAAQTYQYSKEWKDKLMAAFTANEDEISRIDIEYGQFLGMLINNFISEHDIAIVDFVASHGHTIFHKPDEGWTLQIGNGQEIAKHTGAKVICDFRTQDVELGGQGAPLVPIGDQHLFKEYDYCLNLGGFANISYHNGSHRIAYDVCPVNIVLNHYAKKLGFEYDHNGDIASSGKVNQELLKRLNELPFYNLEAPKSLGLEWVDARVFPLILKFDLAIEDILCTFIEHIAIQITHQFNDANKIVLVTGGGVYNRFLMSRISDLTKANIVIPEADLIDFKEALIFAFLGLLKTQDEINILSSVTGASHDHSSGKIFHPISS